MRSGRSGDHHAWRASAIAFLGLALLLAAGWVASHAAYHSWHPCDWLLQDSVDRLLERRGIDPDTASIPLKATASESTEVQLVLRLRSTPARCLATWAAGQISP